MKRKDIAQHWLSYEREFKSTYPGAKCSDCDKGWESILSPLGLLLDESQVYTHWLCVDCHIAASIEMRIESLSNMMSEVIRDPIMSNTLKKINTMASAPGSDNK